MTGPLHRDRERAQWLAGHLDGVETRVRREDLADTFDAAIERGVDVAPFLVALAAQDPATAAEICVGPRAVGGSRRVAAALVVVARLSTVIPAAGLYHRLVELAPEQAGAVLDDALARYAGAVWLPKLCRRVEATPGLRWLERDLAAGVPVPDALDRVARVGLLPALTAFAVRHRSIEPIASLAHAGFVAEALALASQLRTVAPEAPVEAALLALFGPDGPPPA